MSDAQQLRARDAAYQNHRPTAASRAAPATDSMAAISQTRCRRWFGVCRSTPRSSIEAKRLAARSSLRPLRARFAARSAGSVWSVSIPGVLVKVGSAVESPA